CHARRGDRLDAQHRPLQSQQQPARIAGLGIVRVAHVLGDRRDHFESLKDVWQMFEIIIAERKRREIDPTIEMLRACLDEKQAKADSVCPKVCSPVSPNCAEKSKNCWSWREARPYERPALAHPHRLAGRAPQ